MKVYEFGSPTAPALLLLPGTCCHWKGNFGHVIPLLEGDFRVLCVSYDGFDETERTGFPAMEEETGKIEAWIQTHCGGHIRGAYGCSLGGLLCGTDGSPGEDHHGLWHPGELRPGPGVPLAAKLQTSLLLPLIYPVIRDGQFKSRLLQKKLARRRAEMGPYVEAFLRMMGGARPYITQQSCKNQFYSDLVTPLPGHIDVPGTEIHIFYALKMGAKYRERYLRHFAHPVIHEQELQHEELLACDPEQWAALVKTICSGKKEGS